MIVISYNCKRSHTSPIPPPPIPPPIPPPSPLPPPSLPSLSLCMQNDAVSACMGERKGFWVIFSILSTSTLDIDLLDSLAAPSIGHLFAFEVCSSSFLCYYEGNHTICDIQYNRRLQSGSERTNDRVQRSLLTYNESFLLEDVIAFRDYDFKITFSLNSSFRREITGSFRNEFSTYHFLRICTKNSDSVPVLSIIEKIATTGLSIEIFKLPGSLNPGSLNSFHCTYVA